MIIKFVSKRFMAWKTRIHTINELVIISFSNQIFGDNVFNYCLLVYTKAELVLNDLSLEEFLETEKRHPLYSQFLEAINYRIVTVNNSSTVEEVKKSNRQKIIESVENIVKKNKEHQVYPKILSKTVKRLYEKLPQDILHPSIANAVIEVISTTFAEGMVHKNKWLATKVVNTLQKCELCEITSEYFKFSNDGNCHSFNYEECWNNIEYLCGVTKRSLETRDALVALFCILISFLIFCYFIIASF